MHELTVPFDALMQLTQGQLNYYQTPIPKSRIQGFGFTIFGPVALLLRLLIAFLAGAEGPFRLEVEWLQVVVPVCCGMRTDF